VSASEYAGLASGDLAAVADAATEGWGIFNLYGITAGTVGNNCAISSDLDAAGDDTAVNQDPCAGRENDATVDDPSLDRAGRDVDTNLRARDATDVDDAAGHQQRARNDHDAAAADRSCIGDAAAEIGSADQYFVSRTGKLAATDGKRPLIRHYAPLANQSLGRWFGSFGCPHSARNRKMTSGTSPEVIRSRVPFKDAVWPFRVISLTQIARVFAP